jgi:hypothetical protein
MPQSPFTSVLRYGIQPDWGRMPSGEYVSMYSSPFYADGSHSNVVIDNIAYVSAWANNGWTLLDIANPGQPEVIGFVSGDEWDRATHLSVDIDRGLLYSVSERGDSFVITDVSLPTSPFVVASFQDSVNFETPVACAHVGNYCLAIARGDETTGILYVFDCSTPEAFSIAYRLEDAVNLLNCRDIAISADGNTAYIACRSKLLAIVNITNKSLPAVIDVIDLSSINCGAHSVDVIDSDYVAVCGTNTFAILNVTTGAITGSYTNSTNLNAAYSVATHGDYAYVASRWGHSLTVIDISNYAAPAYVTKYANSDVIGDAYYVTVSDDGNYAYVSGYSSDSFVIFDISNPALLGKTRSNALKPLRAIRDRYTGSRNTPPQRRITRRSAVYSSIPAAKTSEGTVNFEYAPGEYKELAAAALGSSVVSVDYTTPFSAQLVNSTLTATGADFDALGIYPGQWLGISGSGVDPSNTGVFQVASVDGDDIVFDHSFTLQTSIPSVNLYGYSMRDGVTEWPLLLEREFGTNPDYLLFKDNAVSRLELTFPPSGASSGSISFIGGEYAYDSASIGEHDPFSVEIPLSNGEFTSFEIGGVAACLISLDLSVRNDWKRNYTNHNIASNKLTLKERTITGKFTLHFDTLAQAASFADSEVTRISCRYDGDSTFVLYCPKVTLKAPTIQGVERGWAIELNAEFEAQIDDTLNYSIQMDVI